MTARVSRGCLRCRTRRVKCDQTRPSCQRCIKRGEDCVGYRDDATLLFKSENENVAKKVRRRASFDSTLLPNDIKLSHQINHELSNAKAAMRQSIPTVEDHIITDFFEKYVVYPCSDRSSPGFLEHLPSLFKEVEVEGRYALRWAVRAAAYASMSATEQKDGHRQRALHCYGLALSALGVALSDPKRAPDDYTLMTIVVLDLFESIYLPDSVDSETHAIGMAQMLRLRGVNNIHGARGWSIFRLSYHRIQKQQLAYKQAPFPESEVWLTSLSDNSPCMVNEQYSLQISQTCHRARMLQKSLDNSSASIDQVLTMIFEMHELDHLSTTWRERPEWNYKTVEWTPDLPIRQQSVRFPAFVQLHGDIWLAYEWNYHRTARIILHTHLLETIARHQSVMMDEDTWQMRRISSLKELSISIIRNLVDDILSTVPQSLGDIDHEGKITESSTRIKMCFGIGGYFLLWPIKVIKGNTFATTEQAVAAKSVFERIRECTGMKSILGDKSLI